MKIKQLKIINQDESTEIADIGADAVNIDYNDTTVKAELDKLNTDNNINKNNITNLQSGLNTTSANLALQTSRIDNLSGELEEGSTTFDAEIVDARVDYEGGIASSLGASVREQFKKINDEYETGKNMYDILKSSSHSLINMSTGEVIDYSDQPTSVGYKYTTSDFIKIKQGVPITFNGQRITAIYNNKKQFYTSFQDDRNAHSEWYPTTYTPTIDGYLRTSVSLSKASTFQVEEGESATSFEPYIKKWKYSKEWEEDLNTRMDEVENIAKSNKESLDINKVTYFENSGWNMVNKANIRENIFVMGGDASSNYMYTDGVTLNNYWTSQPMKIIPGEKYTFRCRCWKTYGNDGMKIRNSNAGYNHSKTTITAQENEYFLVISDGNEWLSVARCEKGTEETSPYEDFKIKIPGLDISSSLPPTDNMKSMIKLEKAGNIFYLTKNLDDENKLTIQTDRYGSGNGGFNFINTTLNNEQFHATSDDITPLRTFQTVGANHLYTCWTQNNLGDLTTADLGSIWTDGNHNFCLIDIDSDNKPYFMADYTITNEIVSANIREPARNLTHVSGATHTSTIAKNGSTKTNAIIAEYIKNVDYYINDTKIENDGNYYTDNVKVVENYDILSYKGIYDWATSHIGSNYKNYLSNIGVTIKQSNIFSFDKELTCIISSNIYAVEKVNLQDCGFLQSYKVSGAKRYMFGINSVNNQDFTQGVNVSDITTSLIIWKTYWKNESIPPTYYIDSLSSKGLSFTMGYLPEFSKTSIATRKDIISNRAWDLRDTGKSYPIAISGQTLNSGDSLTFKGFRKYIKNNDSFTIKLKDVEYYFINGIENVPCRTIRELTTKGEILASDRFTIKDLDSMTYSIEKGGYAIIKKINS